MSVPPGGDDFLFRPRGFFFDSDPFGERTIRDTSIQAFREIAPSLAAREAAVLAALTACPEPPTGRELMQRMGETDASRVRPRITALAERGVVQMGPSRTCRVTGKTAHVWVVTHV